MAKPVIPNPGTGTGGDGGSKTTFVQADSTCFRDLVQRLTGPSGNEAPAAIKSPAPKPAQKLHERRKYKQPKLDISTPIAFHSFQPKIPSSPPMVGSMSPGGGYGPGPWSCPASPSSSILMSPPRSLQASPTSTPVYALTRGSNKRLSPSAMDIDFGEEERAIKEKRFYLHQSPRSKMRLASEPELLTLFPLTSPNADSSATHKT
ncbi:VQ motif-containing protein 31 [Sesamum angolense]|uniref:VQ motif-containing protein 31 n=1 Tax=Sesamum angolense TaxID=2727404 RepID=A0AAE1WJC3_9LAMI|nr:VQ motif-containing protein 31 [Sesamum angolense]